MLNLRHFKIGTRLIMTTVGALAMMIAIVAIALFSLNTIGGKVDHIANGNIKKTELVFDMETRNLLIGRHVRTALIHEETEKQQAEQKKVEADLRAYLASESQIGGTLDSADAKEIFARILGARKDAEASIAQMFSLVRAGSQPEIEAHFFNSFRPKMQVWFDVVDEMLQLQKENNRGDVAEIEAIKASVQTTMLLLIGFAVIIMIPAGIWVTRQITGPLDAAVDVADAVASGNLDNSIDLSGGDEPARLMNALSSMQAGLKARTEAEHKVANEALRIKVALDVSSNSVMVADPGGVIIYCNAAALSMMRAAEDDIRKDLPAFRVNSIVGSNFDIYHKNASHQRNLLAGLKGMHRSQIVVGGRTFNLVASPIVNELNERLGTVVEWADRTAEVAIEEEVSGIIAAAASGDFSCRIDAHEMNGFFRQISTGINDLLEVNSRALADVGAMLTRLSQGDLTQKIDTDYQGVLGQLKEDANVTVDNLQEIIFSIKNATDAINTAAQEIASGNQDLSGRTEQQASNLEETASSMEQLTSTVKQNADNARKASELAGSAQLVAEKGGQVVGQVVETMGAIHLASNRISDIISVIDGIAFQTNILALNAAVEAARAGEQGRGFAVVATEVRNLAQRSAAAAKEIKALISDSVDKVQTGGRLVDQAGQTMGEVVASIQRVAKIMSDISYASREQTAGIEQVGLAVSQMDEMTQQNAALVEQAAAAAESLEEQARNLAESVAVFRLSGSLVVQGQSALAGLDFNGAIAAHGKWKQRLLDYVAGGGEQLDPALVGRDDQCALGCWIHGDGRTLSSNAKYTELKDEHAGFHRCAAEVIRTQLAGNVDGARAQISGEFSNRSARVIGLLESMRGGDKRGAPRQLTSPASGSVSSVKLPALAAPDEDEWEEF
ncbi:MAG: diguanylate cyclase [Betaproteobacteria bacterium HGW-Betaproteobacteria-6]|jgi:methyl-accepting chemotaxis protein|nr:MAG: diguanylate cyclase [Betaproteobacteria bacterium HGW-Betaproteobacteria-6]